MTFGMRRFSVQSAGPDVDFFQFVSPHVERFLKEVGYTVERILGIAVGTSASALAQDSYGIFSNITVPESFTFRGNLELKSPEGQGPGVLQNSVRPFPFDVDVDTKPLKDVLSKHGVRRVFEKFGDGGRDWASIYAELDAALLRCSVTLNLSIEGVPYPFHGTLEEGVIREP